MATDLACMTYSIDEAAQVLGVGKDVLYRAAKRGEFPAFRLGRALRVSRDYVDKLLAGDPETVGARGF